MHHLVGFDDAPFERSYRGDVLVVGAVFSGARLDGVLSGRVRRDGANATRVIAALVAGSRWAPQLHAVLLQGIAVAGFNVIDIAALRRAAGLPVLVVMRHRPDCDAVQAALRGHVPGGERKWRLIEAAGPVEEAAGVYVQRCGIGLDEAARLIEASRTGGRMPEPLRVAHLIAGGIVRGESCGRV